MTEDSRQQADAAATTDAENREALLAGIGKRLRAAREEQGHSIGDVATALNLRKVYIQALEDGRWEDMPGEVYALGFLRQYAAHLGLDMDADIQQLKSGEYRLTRPLTFPDPPIAPSKTWSVIAAVFFVALFVLFNIFSQSDKQPQRVVSEQLSPPAVSPAPAPPSREPEQPASEQQAVPQAAEQSAEPLPSLAITTELPPIHHYVFEAVGDSAWLQVFKEPGESHMEAELIREVLLQPGERLALDDTADTLLVTCGNAAALQIRVDGRIHVEAGSLGESGKVLRNYRLTATAGTSE
ncbi:MAG: helix-turn-helix domain-containing protein [Mariprofundaceae bacterium]|nr:helix-turn-helix domain-containing protein [Mariprofundaceae bacterium]